MLPQGAGSGGEALLATAFQSVLYKETTDMTALSADFKEREFPLFEKAFKELVQKRGSESVSRNSRLLNIRFRLTLDLEVSINTDLSYTRTKEVRESYVLLYQFVDLWNVYEVLHKLGQNLQVSQSKSTEWNREFLESSNCFSLLQECAEWINKDLENSSFKKTFIAYLEHFSQLEAVKSQNREKYSALLSSLENKIEEEHLLFLMYMERNAFYHGGEAANSGTNNYVHRKKILSLYINFLRTFIARAGKTLFNMELSLS